MALWLTESRAYNDRSAQSNNLRQLIQITGIKRHGAIGPIGLGTSTMDGKMP